MRKITLIGTAAAMLAAVTAFATPASADRVCRQVCDNGFCRSRCVETGDRVYYDRDRDYDHHHRPGIELRGPGVGVEIGR